MTEEEERELNRIAVERFNKQLPSLDDAEMREVRHLETWQRFARWMDEHDTGPGSVTVGQVGREFPLPYTTIGAWMRHYRSSKNGKAEA